MEQLCYIIFTGLLLLVIAIDVHSFRIPNWLNVIIMGFFPLWILGAGMPFDWMSSLSMSSVFFVVGFSLFSLKIMGGGDTKLLAVLGLYTGWSEAALALVIYTALLGGVITIGTLIARYMLPPLFRTLKMKTIPRLFTIGEPMVPYGPAIAGAMLIVMWTGKLTAI